MKRPFCVTTLVQCHGNDITTAAIHTAGVEEFIQKDFGIGMLMLTKAQDCLTEIVLVVQCLLAVSPFAKLDQEKKMSGEEKKRYIGI